METLIFIAGIIQVSILSASLLVPFIMDYTNALSNLRPMVKKLFWVYGVYTAGTILFLGVMSMAFSEELLKGGIMKFFLGFYLAFWGGRLFLQLAVYDMKIYLKEWWMKLGYNMLTIAFTYLTVVYGSALILN